MKNASTLIACMATALFLTTGSAAQAQPGPGMGMWQGFGAGPGKGMGMGQSYGRGRGNCFSNSNFRGWTLMTAEERISHRNQMLAAKTYDECRAIQEEQHKAMAERAKEQGKILPTPRWTSCDRMKAQGFLK